MMVAGTTVNTAYWKLYPCPPPDKSQEFRVCLYVYATYFILAVNIINPHGKKKQKKTERSLILSEPLFFNGKERPRRRLES